MMGDSPRGTGQPGSTHLGTGQPGSTALGTCQPGSTPREPESSSYTPSLGYHVRFHVEMKD